MLFVPEPREGAHRVQDRLFLLIRAQRPGPAGFVRAPDSVEVGAIEHPGQGRQAGGVLLARQGQGGVPGDILDRIVEQLPEPPDRLRGLERAEGIRADLAQIGLVVVEERQEGGDRARILKRPQPQAA